jgi:photosystem II stability/assembly factor-like uncharacterized protein
MKRLKLIFLTALITIPGLAQQFELIGPPGAFAGTIVIKVHPTKQNVVYSGNAVLGGLFVYDNGSTSIILNEIEDYPVSSIAISKDTEGTIYIGDLFYRYLRSTDNGKSFDTLMHDESLTKIIKIHPLNSNVLFAKRNTKEIWRSNNKGNSWYKLGAFSEEIKSFDIYEQDTSIIYLATRTNLYKSTNSGKDWIDKMFLPNATWNMEINQKNSKVIYLQLGGYLYKSNDGGETILRIFGPQVWTIKLNQSDTSVIYAAVAYDDVGITRGIYKSTDAGITWKKKMNGIEYDPPSWIPPTQAIEINPNNKDEVYIGVDQKGVFKSTDGGESWHNTNLSYMPATSLIPDKDNLNNIICGNMGWGIIKTSDGGKQWQYPAFDIKPEKIVFAERSFSINPLNKQEGYLGGTNYVYKTTDGGSSWQQINELAGEGINYIYYHPNNPSIMIAGGYNRYATISTDQGKSWSEELYNIPRDARFVNGNDSLFYYRGAKQIAGSSYDWFVGKSTDFGKTYEECKNGLLYDNESSSYVDIIDVEVNADNPDEVYCAQRGRLSKTIDGGKNWFRVDTSLKILEPWVGINDLFLSGKERLFVSVQGGGIPFSSYTFGGLYLTDDDCKTWRRIYIGEVRDIFSDEGSPANIYFSTQYGVMRFLDTLTVTDVMPEEAIKPAHFQLLQNYPNPFNPSTTIKFTIPASLNPSQGGTLITLKVYDILGREIKTLVDENKTVGEYSVTWDGKDKTGNEVSSGIYFYNIKFGDNSITKKMVLMR